MRSTTGRSQQSATISASRPPTQSGSRRVRRAHSLRPLWDGSDNRPGGKRSVLERRLVELHPVAYGPSDVVAGVGDCRCTLEPMGYIVVGFYRALPYGEAVTAIAASVKEGSVVRS